MNTEDLFKYGVTPKSESHKGYGKRYDVININEKGLDVRMHGTDNAIVHFDHGSYNLWQEPKTLFEDDSIPATWGNLKKAVEKAGVSDDTEFAVQEDASWLYRGICRPATFSVETLREIYNKPKKYIVVR